MIFLGELFAHVLSSLLRNKLRSLLTMAGIAWGVASIVLIVAMGDGFKSGQRDRFRAIGDNIVVVFGGRTANQAGGWRAGHRIRPEYDDVRSIRTECFRVTAVTGELQSLNRAVSPYNSGVFWVLGVEGTYPKIRNVAVDRGRFLTGEDDAASARNAVLGDNVRKQLFGDRPVAPGATVAINGLPFRIVGLMPPKDQNSSYNGLDTDKIFVPYSTAVRDLPPTDPNYHPGILTDIIYIPASLDDWQAAREQVVRLMARRHRFEPADPSALFIWDTVENAQLTDRIFSSMTLFLGAIAAITLALGGVGVMNIMLVSVTERTREIGLRKAVGATRRRILADFLLEGVVLAAASGMVGWLAARGLAAVVNSLPKVEMFGGLPVSGATTAVAFAALGVVAILSAVWPAWRAASLTPVEALRYER